MRRCMLHIMRVASRCACLSLLVALLHIHAASSFHGGTGAVALPASSAPITTRLFGAPRPLPERLRVGAAVASLAVSLAALGGGCPLPAGATGDGYLTERQHLVAEAWRAVDKKFVDRTFNGHDDWFKLRQDAVRRSYGSDEEAYEAAGEVLSALGDPYTRFLPPAKFESVVNAATSSVGGVGVELLEVDQRGASSLQGGAGGGAGSVAVVVGDVQAKSPALAAGLARGDVITSVDGAAVGLARGPPQSTRRLSALRAWASR